MSCACSSESPSVFQSTSDIFLKSRLISKYPVIMIRLGFRDCFTDGGDGGLQLCSVIKSIYSVTVREDFTLVHLFQSCSWCDTVGGSIDRK